MRFGLKLAPCIILWNFAHNGHNRHTVLVGTLHICRYCLLAFQSRISPLSCRFGAFSMFIISESFPDLCRCTGKVIATKNVTKWVHNSCDGTCFLSYQICHIATAKQIFVHTKTEVSQENLTVDIALRTHDFKFGPWRSRSLWLHTIC